MTAPLSKEKRVGSVAEIAEVEAEIERLEYEGNQMCLDEPGGGPVRTAGIARFNRAKDLRARLADLKRREASDER